jgi:hypothetical protein
MSYALRPSGGPGGAQLVTGSSINVQDLYSTQAEASEGKIKATKVDVREECREVFGQNQISVECGPCVGRFSMSSDPKCLVAELHGFKQYNFSLQFTSTAHHESITAP